MGLGGTIVVALAVLYALTFLPALLAILGARVNMGTLPVRIGDQRGFWSRVANAVMRRPVMVLIPTLALMVAVGSPFLRLKMAGADITLLPLSTEARQGYEMLRVQYPDQVRTRIVAIAKFASGPVLSPPRISALYDLSRRVSALPGVVRVESVVDLDPSFTRSNYEALLSMPRILMPNLLAYAIHETVGPHIVILSVVTDHETASTEARDIVRAIRANRRVGDGEILGDGYDGARSRHHGLHDAAHSRGGRVRHDSHVHHSVLAPRLGDSAAQGRGDERALHDGLVRRARMDLSGRASAPSAAVSSPARWNRRCPFSCSARCSASRWTTRCCS